jgi:signal recognition particle subunit SRP54
VEEAKIAISPERARSLLKGKLTITDLCEQLEALRRMGSLRRILKMIPTLGYALPDEVVDVAEDKLKKWHCIIQSMTKEEREDPTIIRGSRLQRIARGSGSSDKEVKELLQYYLLMRKSMKKLLREGRKLPWAKLLGLKGWNVKVEGLPIEN